MARASHSRRGGQTAGFWSSPFVRLTAYYLMLMAVGFALLTAFPALGQVFSLQRLSELAAGEFTPVGVGGEPALSPVESGLAALMAIAGALIMLAPVVWVYMLTKQHQGYDESVVHTVIILPIPITGLVIVVQNSLALAFSLAGIVAAVRFRNTLKDTKDAVYIFLAIATALAAGAQALAIAFVTSVVFNYVVLFTWSKKIGNIYADQLSRTPRMRLGDVLAGVGTPGAGTGQLTIGDPSLLQALTPSDLKQIAERKARLREIVESAGKAEKYNGLIVIHAKGNEQFLDAVGEVLQEHTEVHKLADISSAPDGNSTLEYLVGLPKKGLNASELMGILRARAGKHIIAAEFRNLNVKKVKEQPGQHWELHTKA